MAAAQAGGGTTPAPGASAPVVVVGAGLAGLACARALSATGAAVLLLEAGDAVGGRMRTDRVAGFAIDRGFQVLNTGYPELRRAVDLGAVDLRYLPRGVQVRRDGRLEDLPHPLAAPSAPWRALTSGAAGLGQKVALARYAAPLVLGTAASVKRRRDVPAREAWKDLPPEVVDRLLVPFLTGVVLEREITASRVFTDLMMRMFALGASAVPALGMQRVPESMAAALPPGVLRLEAPVASVAADGVTLEDGTTLEASAVVVAADAWTATRLVPALGAPPEPRSVTTHYFAAPAWRGQSGTLVVDADGSPVANSVILTASAPEYSGDGRSLIATSVVTTGRTEPVDPQVVLATARAMHEAPAGEWEPVAVREIPHALPAMTAPHPLRRPARVDGVYVAGDHRDTSSIQGALVSGRRVARAVLTDR